MALDVDGLSECNHSTLLVRYRKQNGPGRKEGGGGATHKGTKTRDWRGG